MIIFHPAPHDVPLFFHQSTIIPWDEWRCWHQFCWLTGSLQCNIWHASTGFLSIFVIKSRLIFWSIKPAQRPLRGRKSSDENVEAGRKCTHTSLLFEQHLHYGDDNSYYSAISGQCFDRISPFPSIFWASLAAAAVAADDGTAMSAWVSNASTSTSTGSWLNSSAILLHNTQLVEG